MKTIEQKDQDTVVIDGVEYMTEEILLERVRIAREEERGKVLERIKALEGGALFRRDEYDHDGEYEAAHTQSKIIEVLESLRNFIKNMI